MLFTILIICVGNNQTIGCSKCCLHQISAYSMEYLVHTYLPDPLSTEYAGDKDKRDYRYYRQDKTKRYQANSYTRVLTNNQPAILVLIFYIVAQ